MKCHLGRQKKQSTTVTETDIEIFGCLALHPITLRKKEGNRTSDIGTCRPKDLLYLTIHVLENQFHFCTRLVYATFELHLVSITKIDNKKSEMSLFAVYRCHEKRQKTENKVSAFVSLHFVNMFYQTT